MAATRQSPEPAAAEPSRLAGIHAPVTRVASVPLPRAVNHWLLQPGIEESRPFSDSWSHSAAHFLVPASWELMVTLVVPLTVNGLPPACQIMLVVKPGSPLSLVMYSFGLAACSLVASAMYWSQVVGTVRPYLSKIFLL